MEELIHFFSLNVRESKYQFQTLWTFLSFWYIKVKVFFRKIFFKTVFPFVYNISYSSFDSIRYVIKQLSLVSLYRPAMKFLVNFWFVTLPARKLLAMCALVSRLLGRLIQEPFVCFGQISDFISISMNANRLWSTVRGVLEKFLLFYLTDRILYQFKIGAK